MKTYVIYGASDDLIEVRGALGEEWNCYDEHGAQLLLDREPDTDHRRGAAIVHLRLEMSGCWSVGVSPVDEDAVIPESWNFELRPGTGVREDLHAPPYSMVLFATVDDDVVLTRIGADA